MNCKYCKADCVHRGEDREKECRGHIHMTNADRIRSMSDEELANNLMHKFHATSEVIPFCVWNEKCDSLVDTEDGIPESMCMECLLKWLQQPAGGEP